MTISATVDLVQGDNLPGIQATIRDRNTPLDGDYLDDRDPSTWAHVDLTTAVVTAAIREVGGTEIIDTVQLAEVDPSKGIVILILADTKFQSTAGAYELEATVVYEDSGQQTVYDFIGLNVRERF